MPVMILILLMLLPHFSWAGSTSGRELQNRVTHLQELQARIKRDCINNPNRDEVKVVINGKTLTCGHLIILANRLKNELNQDITRLKESCSATPQGQQEQLARQAAQAAQAAACKPVSTDTQCLPLYACAAMTMTSPIFTLIGGIQRLGGDRNSCLARGAGATPGCLQNVVKGIFDSLWGLVSLVWDIGKAAVRKFGEWTGLIQRQERSSSEKLMAAQQAGPGFIRRFISDPGGTIKQMASAMFNGIKTAAMSSYGCEQWSGAPFVSRCLRPMTNWNCASCQQKLQLMCGVAGFAIGEIGTALLTGGLAAGGRAVAVAALDGVRAGARASRFSRLAVGVIKAIPRPPPALLRAAGAVAEATAPVLTGAQRLAIRSFEAVVDNPLTRTIGSAARAVDKSIVGEATRFVLRPAAFYLDAMEEAAALGYKTVDTAIARVTTRATTGADAAIVAARSTEAQRPQGLTEVTTAVPQDARATTTLSSSEVDTLVGPAERNGSLTADVPLSPQAARAETDAILEDISLARTVGDDTEEAARAIRSPASETPTPTPTPAPQNGAIVVANDTGDAVRTTTRVESSVVSPTNNGTFTLPGRNSNEIRVVTPGSETRTIRAANDDFIELSPASSAQLRSVGLTEDNLINPFPAPVRKATETEAEKAARELAESQRAREIAWTKADLEGRFAQWRADGVYDDIFSALGKLGTEQEKRRYLAILLNSPKTEVRATLERLRSFANADKANYFKKLDTMVSGLDTEIAAAEKLPASMDRAERLAALSRKRSALLQERTLLMGGDDLEIVNIFSSRASNQNYLDKDYLPHSLEDSFSVDLKVKNNTSVCRGSFAGAGAVSNLAGSFTTFCRDSSFSDRNGLQRYLAAPGDRERVGRATNGYERFNKFDLQPGDNITLGLNGPVKYTDAGQLGTGGTGGGVELFTYRAPKSPVTIDRLSGSVRTPSCPRSECERLFRIQEDINPRNLANQSDPVRYLDHSARQVNGEIARLDSRIEDYVRSLTEGGDPNLINLRENFADVRSAFNLKREIELKRGIRPGTLDADTVILRDFTKSAEGLGKEVLADIKARGITDPQEINRLFREAIEKSPITKAHQDNLRFIEEGVNRLRSGTLSQTERNELLYQLSVRAGQEEDLALVFRTLDYKVSSAAKEIGGNEARTAVNDVVRNIQGNGLTAPTKLDPRITPQLRQAAGLGDIQRVQEASVALERQLTRAQQDAVLRAHDVGAGTGRGFFTYTPEEIREKGLILKNAGFSAPEIRTLVERGITGSLPDAVDAFSAARSNLVSMRDLRARIGNTASEARAPLLEQLRTGYRESADGYLAEAMRKRDAQFLGESWRLYARSGDANSAVRMMETGVRDFGMNKPAVIKSIDQEIARVERDIGGRADANPALILERDTLKRARAQYAGPTTPERPAITVSNPTPTPTPAPTPRPAPQVSSVQPRPAPQPTPAPEVVPEVPRAPAGKSMPDVSRVSPRQAQDIGNDYRLGMNGKPKDPQIAAEYYYRAMEGVIQEGAGKIRKSGSFEFRNNRNLDNAVTESLSSDGKIALRVFDEVYAAGGSKAANSYLLEFSQTYNTGSKNPVVRENIMKLIKHVEEVHQRDGFLFDPQRNYLRSWTSANNW